MEGNSLCKGLLASEKTASAISLELPDDQWVRELRLWFETALVNVPMGLPGFLGYVNQSMSPIDQVSWIFHPIENMSTGSERDAIERYCHSHKMKYTAHQNFNFLALILTIVSSLFIIAISIFLEPLLAFMRRRRWTGKTSDSGRVRQVARDLDDKYWLLGIALGTVAEGNWARSGKRPASSILIPRHKVRFRAPASSELFYRSTSNTVSSRDTVVLASEK